MYLHRLPFSVPTRVVLSEYLTRIFGSRSAANLLGALAVQHGGLPGHESIEHGRGERPQRLPQVGRLRAVGAVPPLTQALGWVGRVQASTWGGGSHPRQRLLRLAALVARPHHLQVLDSAVHPLSLEAQVARYTYLLDVEGNGWSGRLKLLLWSQRVVFLVDRPWKEDFFADLRPWMHFVPVRRDLSDLMERLDWAHANPERCHAIAQAALAFAMSRLRLQDALRRLASAVREGLLLAPPGFPQVNIR